MEKRYRAIFFDWDGTAVKSRTAPAEEVISRMQPLLASGVALVVVSGTTLENISGGSLYSCFTPAERQNLFMGLARGAYNYRAGEDGEPYVWKSRVPERTELLLVHDVCHQLHQTLYRNWGIPTDIVYSRPNYCKIDLMVESGRAGQLYMQGDELAALARHLEAHGLEGGLNALMALGAGISRQNGLEMFLTCDAKYLEVGLSTKSHNVTDILEMLQEERGIAAEECSYWGDEYVELAPGIWGSDSYMITPASRGGDFFDVSDIEGRRPPKVRHLGGSVQRFLRLLEVQAE